MVVMRGFALGRHIAYSKKFAGLSRPSPGSNLDWRSEAVGPGKKLVPYRAKFIATGAVGRRVRPAHPSQA